MNHLEVKKKTVYLLGVYRPPSANLEDALNIISSTLDEIPTWKCPTIIMGDINIDMLTQNQNRNKLENMLSSHNIERLELPPTRVTSTSATSIDMVCSNLISKDINVDVITTGLSDHKAQISTINVQPQNLKLPSSTRRQYNQENLNQLKIILSNVTWCDIYNKIEVDQAYDSFNNTLILALNTACPTKKLRSKKKRKFGVVIDEDTQTLKHNYLQALDRMLLHGSEENKTETAARKREYDLKLKEKQKEITSNYIQNCENKQRALWFKTVKTNKELFGR
ncbi:hypothetical protein J6590_108443 [Homalodisca vitripennis]|nr:hypothetical protein J6590_108443 [Homalodisca vitripennis]